MPTYDPRVELPQYSPQARDAIANGARDAGVTNPNAVAALVGRAWQENGFGNSVGDGGSSQGAFQIGNGVWNQWRQHAQRNGINPNNQYEQTKYLVNYFRTNRPQLWTRLQNATTPKEAFDAWTYKDPKNPLKSWNYGGHKWKGEKYADDYLRETGRQTPTVTPVAEHVGPRPISSSELMPTPEAPAAPGPPTDTPRFADYPLAPPPAPGMPGMPTDIPEFREEAALPQFAENAMPIPSEWLMPGPPEEGAPVFEEEPLVALGAPPPPDPPTDTPTFTDEPFALPNAAPPTMLAAGGAPGTLNFGHLNQALGPFQMPGFAGSRPNPTPTPTGRVLIGDETKTPLVVNSGSTSGGARIGAAGAGAEVTPVDVSGAQPALPLNSGGALAALPTGNFFRESWPNPVPTDYSLGTDIPQHGMPWEYAGRNAIVGSVVGVAPNGMPIVQGPNGERRIVGLDPTGRRDPNLPPNPPQIRTVAGQAQAGTNFAMDGWGGMAGVGQEGHVGKHNAGTSWSSDTGLASANDAQAAGPGGAIQSQEMRGFLDEATGTGRDARNAGAIRTLTNDPSYAARQKQGNQEWVAMQKAAKKNPYKPGVTTSFPTT